MARRQGLSRSMRELPQPTSSERWRVAMHALWSDDGDHFGGHSLRWSEPNSEVDAPDATQAPYSLIPLPSLRAAPRRFQPPTPIRIEYNDITEPSSQSDSSQDSPSHHQQQQEELSQQTIKASEPQSHYQSQLEQDVKETRTLAQLETIFKAHDEGSLEPKEILLFCNHLARITHSVTTTVKVWNQTDSLYQQLLSGLHGRLDELNPYGHIVLLSSMARLRHTPSEAWLDSFFTINEPHLKKSGTGNLSAIIMALSSLPLDPWVIKATPSFSLWFESFLALSLRKMVAFRGDELVKLITSLSALLYKPPREWMDAFTAALDNKLPTMDAPLISNSMLALASLGYEPEKPIMKSYYLQLYSKLPMFDDQDLATTAQAFAILRRLIKQDFFDEFLSEVVLKLPSFSSNATANLLVALATIITPKAHGGRLYDHRSKMRRRELAEQARSSSNLRVTDDALAAFAELVRERMWHFSGDALANSLWGLLKLGYQPEASFAEACISASQTKLYAMKITQMNRMIYVAGALATFIPRSQGASIHWGSSFDTWCQECTRLVLRRAYNMESCCELIEALSLLPRSQKYMNHTFIQRILRVTRSRNSRSVSARGIASLARSLLILGHKPDFAFMHNFSQVARFKWTDFTPDEYADLIAAMAEFSCPKSADPLWTTEFLAIIQCRFHEFPPSAMALLLSSAVKLPGIKPGAQWLALAVARVQRSCSEYSAEQMARILIALCKFNYRPPADVFDLFVQHVSSRSESLPPSLTDPLSDSLTDMVSSYLLDGGDGHEGYQEVQMKLRSREVPMRVMSQDYPAESSGSKVEEEAAAGEEGGGTGEEEDQITVVGANGSQKEVRLKPKRNRSKAVEVLT